MMRMYLSSLAFIAGLMFWSGLPASMYTQDVSEEDLIQDIATASSDSLKVNAMNDLANYYLNIGEFDKATTTLSQSINLAQEIMYRKGEAEALKFKGFAGYYMEDQFDAINYLRQSLELYKRAGDSAGVANIESNLGGIYMEYGDATAIDFLLPSLRKAEQQKDTFQIVSSALNLAAVYGNLTRERNRAYEYFDLVKSYFESGFDGMEELRPALLSYQAEFNLLEGKYEEAFEELTEALSYEEGRQYHSETLRKMGRAKLGLGEVAEGRQLLNQAINIARKNQQYTELIMALEVLGNSFAESAPQRSLPVLEEALMLAEEGNFLQELADVNYSLYTAYNTLGNFEKALYHHEKFLTFKDSVFNLEANDKIRFAQLNFDLDKKESRIQMLEQESQIADLKQKNYKNVTVATIAAAGLFLILAIGLFNRYKFIKKANNIINKEKERSENLLLNILPQETAQELKEKGSVKAKHFDSVTVMFTDFVGFTKSSETMGPEELVKNVDYFFSKFDTIIEKYGLEKIKTIGDSYMCAAGLPFPSENHAQKMLLAAFDIIAFVEQVSNDPDDGIPGFEIRIGIHTGPVVAGVVGTKKFAYDIWGDTVNVASRMESGSHAGRINISETTYDLVREQFICTYRGEIEVKNKGMLKMYFVNRMKDKALVTKLLET